MQDLSCYQLSCYWSWRASFTRQSPQVSTIWHVLHKAINLKYLEFSALASQNHAFDSTATFYQACHPYKPVGCDDWGIISLRSSVHRLHIDSKGWATRMSATHGTKIMILGMPKNNTLFSMNSRYGHNINTVEDECIWHIVVIRPGYSL